MLSLSLSHSCAALVLLCAFLQIAQRRLSSMLKLSQIVALALGILIFWQAFVQKELFLFGVGFLFMLLQAWALPQALSRIIVKFDVNLKTQRTIPVVWSMLIGLLSVCVAVLLCESKLKMPVPLTEGIMAISFAVILLGVWLVIIQTQLIAQIIGVLTVENGLVLALVNGFSQSWIIVVVLGILLSILACLVLLASWCYDEEAETIAKEADL